MPDELVPPTDRSPALTFEPEEEPTRITCLACGGHHSRNIMGGELHVCDWCTVGTMTPQQVRTWKERAPTPPPPRSEP